eukprot:TRINITY_DN18511_c0_g1_i1.p1 TRINITY_DN18511_c0_g1~~TRINITY_DN18511_c0_g1_i1.p1  ORF type:complete len:376 (+),score=194.84 TRINITY_DN18511_c0_g1_i1:24-1151(+)
MGNKESHPGYSLTANNGQQQHQQRRHQQQQQRPQPRRADDPQAAAKREHMAKLAEQRAKKTRSSKARQADLKKERWDRYKSIDRPPQIINQYESGEKSRKIKVGHTHAVTDSAAAAELDVPTASVTGTAAASAAASELVCPICGEKFLSGEMINRHIDQAHSERGVSVEEQRRRDRLAAMEKRMNKSNLAAGMNKSVKDRKDQHWKAYQAIGGSQSKSNASSSPSSASAATTTTAETKSSSEWPPVDNSAFEPAELDALTDAVAAFKANTGELPDADMAASTKMVTAVISKLYRALLDGKEASVVDRFRKIKLSNAKVQQKITGVPFATDVLNATGFQVLTLPTADGDLEDYLFYKHDLPASRLGVALDLLLSNK